jgi:hypothetical protein
MAASYPVTIASFVNPTGVTPRLGHGALHTQEEQEIVAIETALGISVAGTYGTVAVRLSTLGTLVTAAQTTATAAQTTATGARLLVVPLTSWIAGSVSAGTAYVVAPFAGTVTGYFCQGGAAPAVPGTVNVLVGSAGAILLTATVASAGSNGLVTAMTNTSGTTTIAAGASISITLGASGTAYQQSVTLAVTRTA